MIAHKVLIFSGLLANLLINSPQIAWADTCSNPGLFGCLEAPLPGTAGQSVDEVAKQSNPILSYVKFIVNFVTAMIVILGLIMVVIGGYVYMTAGGDGGKVSQAKTIITSALLGIILALTSYTILNTISPQFADQLSEPKLILLTPTP